MITNDFGIKKKENIYIFKVKIPEKPTAQISQTTQNGKNYKKNIKKKWLPLLDLCDQTGRF